MEQARIDRRTVMIREIDVETWVILRGEAARRRWTTAAMVEHIVREWVDGRSRRPEGEGRLHGDSSASRPERVPDDGSDDGAGIAVATSVPAA